MSDVVARSICAVCRRPEVVCYCRHVTKLATRTRVVILQHPRERDVPINTARIAALCLPNAELEVGVRWSGSSVLTRLLADRERPAALLYPGEGAIDVEANPPAGPITLVAVDGTWWQAKKVLRENPELLALPRYAFRPNAPSSYRIRKEPSEECVSTIEALVHVLGALEGDPERFAAMLDPFRAMVDMQLAYAAKGGGRRHAQFRERRPPDPRRRLPRLLRERPDNVVCVHAEANAWPYVSKTRAEGGDDLMQWSACRVATGETFEAFALPRGEIAPRTAFHMEVDPALLTGAGSSRELLERWNAFARPTDILAAWGPFPIEAFRRIGGHVDAHVDLREAARSHAFGRVGATAQFLDRIGVAQPDRAMGHGRAGIRLAELVAMVDAVVRVSPR